MTCPNCGELVVDAVFCSKECADADPVIYTADDGGQYEGWDPNTVVWTPTQPFAVLTHVEWGAPQKEEDDG